MTRPTPTLARRALAFGLAALLGGLFASQVSAAVVCQKTNKKGKHSFKIRDACLTEKGEVAVNVGTRTTVLHSFAALSGGGEVFIDGDDIAVPLDDASTTVSFDTTAASSSVVVTFSAGCSVLDTSGGGWIDIDINVDDTPVPPTDQPTNAFCFQTGANDEVRHTGSFTVAVEDLAAGSHSIEVLASNVSLSGGLFGPSMSDVSLVVTVHENPDEAPAPPL
jgi:hypothetical protein